MPLWGRGEGREVREEKKGTGTRARSSEDSGPAHHERLGPGRG